MEVSPAGHGRDIEFRRELMKGRNIKVCRAAVAASRKTGACITTHSCRRSRETFDLLTGYGLPPEKLYIGHADFVEVEENEYVCKAGAHVLFTVWGIDRFIPDEMMYKRFIALLQSVMPPLAGTGRQG